MRKLYFTSVVAQSNTDTPAQLSGVNFYMYNQYPIPTIHQGLLYFISIDTILNNKTISILITFILSVIYFRKQWFTSSIAPTVYLLKKEKVL